jgi:ribonucleotide reductase class II
MFDFYMQVQKHWTTHNTSATILFGADEVEPLSQRIYEAIRDDEGYISVALLARFDSNFPRLPFEAIDKQTYEKMVSNIAIHRRKDGDFLAWVSEYSKGQAIAPQDSPCEGLKCEMPDTNSKTKEYMPNSI